MKKLSEVIGDVKKNYGEGTVVQADRGKALQLSRFSTGIFDLDVAIGGGIPWGRMIRLFGPESSCKTGTCLKTLASAQRYCRYCRKLFMPDRSTGELLCGCDNSCIQCGKDYKKVLFESQELSTDHDLDYSKIFDDYTCGCTYKENKKSEAKPVIKNRCGLMRGAFFDVEGTWDSSWARKLGVDTSITYVVQPEYCEQGIDIIDALLRSKEVDVVIVDSLAAMTPSIEIEESVEKQQMGVAAKLINKAMRKWVSSINRRGANSTMKPVMLVINQERDNIGSYFGGSVQPGGRGQKFAASIDIKFKKCKYDDSDVHSWATVHGTIPKNKTAVPRQEFSFRFYLRDAADGSKTGDTKEYKIVLNRAKEVEIITKKGSKFLYKDKEFPTLKGLSEFMRMNDHMFVQLRKETMDKFLSLY